MSKHSISLKSVPFVCVFCGRDTARRSAEIYTGHATQRAPDQTHCSSYPFSTLQPHARKHNLPRLGYTAGATGAPPSIGGGGHGSGAGGLVSRPGSGSRGATLWPKMPWDGVCVGPLRDNQTAPRARRRRNGLMRSQVKSSLGQERPNSFGL